MPYLNLSWEDIQHLWNRLDIDYSTNKLFGIPEGGKTLVEAMTVHATIVTAPRGATHIVDDIIDSGLTRLAAKGLMRPEQKFVALIHKGVDTGFGKWIIFPWESHEDSGYSGETLYEKVPAEEW